MRVDVYVPALKTAVGTLTENDRQRQRWIDGLSHSALLISWAFVQ